MFIENKQVKLEKHGLNSYVFISHNIKQVKSGVLATLLKWKFYRNSLHIFNNNVLVF